MQSVSRYAGRRKSLNRREDGKEQEKKTCHSDTNGELGVDDWRDEWSRRNSPLAPPKNGDEMIPSDRHITQHSRFTAEADALAASSIQFAPMRIVTGMLILGSRRSALEISGAVRKNRCGYQVDLLRVASHLE